MVNPTILKVHPLSEVRARLSGILARFRREGATAEPVAFGTHDRHRRPQMASDRMPIRSPGFSTTSWV